MAGSSETYRNTFMTYRMTMPVYKVVFIHCSQHLSSPTCASKV